MNTIKNRAKTILNLKQYGDYNDPEHIGSVNLNCPYDRQYILRMLVKTPTSDYIIPDELEWLRPMLDKAIKYQEEIGIYQPYCYITVRHGLITSTTDDEWHVDGFSMRITHIPEQNYIWCDKNPTEYIVFPISFPSDFDPLKHNIHLYMKGIIDACNPTIQEVLINEIYCMDPYVIHRRPTLENDVFRTFVRISFTPIMISDDNNTQNPKLSLPKFNYDGVIDFRNKLVDYFG